MAFVVIRHVLIALLEYCYNERKSVEWIYRLIGKQVVGWEKNENVIETSK